MKKKLVLFLILLTFSSACFAEDLSERAQAQAMAAYKKGVEMANVKAYDTALSYFQEALKYNPKMSDAYFNIASIYVAQQNYDDAYNAYVKIIALNPYDYDAILQAAKICYNRKNYALAMKYLKYIPDDYYYYGYVKQLYADAKEQFEEQKKKIERSKVTTATKAKKVLLDRFNSPAGMVVDSEGNIFVASYSDNSIVKIDKNKNRTNFIKDNLLDGPIGLAIDTYDNIYVANFESNNILKVTKGGSVSIFMDNVSKPYFLYIKNDVLYISEQGNDVVVTYNLATKR